MKSRDIFMLTIKLDYVYELALKIMDCKELLGIILQLLVYSDVLMVVLVMIKQLIGIVWKHVHIETLVII